MLPRRHHHHHFLLRDHLADHALHLRALDPSLFLLRQSLPPCSSRERQYVASSYVKVSVCIYI
jgi:hypothetical protein